MKHTMAVFWREITARRDLLFLAVAVLVIVLMMPFVPGTGNYSPSEVRGVASQVLAMLLGCGVAIGLGLSVFGSDLAGGRLGFFFARPVTARAIWAGRILAVLALALVCEFVVLVPAVVENIGRLSDFNAQGWWAILGAFVLLPILLGLAAHALSVMNQSRSAWLLLDLVGLVAVATASWLVIRPLYAMGAALAVSVFATLLALAAAGGFAAAGFAGLSMGRTDVRRMHRAMSVVLWSLLGAAVIGLAMYGGWLRDIGPAEMDDVEVFSVSPDGRWVEVWGGAPLRLDVRRRVLVSAVDGRSVMLPFSWAPYQDELIYSRDGSRAVGFDHQPGSGNLMSMWWLDLEADAPQPVETLLVVASRTVPSLSPDGSRIALFEGGTLSVYDLASEQLVAAIRLPRAFQRATVLFLDHNRLRLYAKFGDNVSWQLRIGEVDLADAEVSETGRVEGLNGSSWLALDAEAKRMILSVWNDRAPVRTRSLRDSRIGTLIREFGRREASRFLADGRLVSLANGLSGDTLLVVERPDGEAIAEHPLGRADWEGLGGEALPGQVVVGRLEDLDERTEGRRYELIDVDTGAVRPIADGLRRAYRGYQWAWGGGVMVHWYIDQPEANRIFTDRTGAVVRWDPETGEMVHVVGGAE